ncbi:MAG: KH domain-containing protein [Candidatus Gracilibacteria bacterium]|nr:KH domain-containing protein [Candidatus Gracilibacteria bacterium]
MEDNKIIESLVKDFLDKLLINYESVEVISESEGIYSIKIKTEESGIIIGPHGKNLESFENILKLLISTKFDKKIKLHLEINDYMHSKDEKLFSFVKSKIELLKNGKDTIILPFLNAYDRKKVHSFIAELDNKKIYTKSVGEGSDRRLHICRINEKITIDIDGDDI